MKFLLMSMHYFSVVGEAVSEDVLKLVQKAVSFAATLVMELDVQAVLDQFVTIASAIKHDP